MISKHTPGQITILTAGMEVLDRRQEQKHKKGRKGTGRGNREVSDKKTVTPNKKFSEMTSEEYERYCKSGGV